MEEKKPKSGRKVGRWLLALVGALLICGVLTVIIGSFADDSAETTAAQEDTPQRSANVVSSEVAEGVAESPAQASAPTDEPPTKSPEPAETVPPTATLVPTDTPAPTHTPRPTATPLPTATPVPPPDPVVLTGSGDDLVDFAGFPDSNLIGAHITGSGSSNFAVWNYDAAGNQIDLLVNEIGAYEGTHLMGISDLEPPTAGFEVNANGPWTIEVFPFEPAYVDTYETPGEFTGRGDNFFIALNDAGINRATITHNGDSNFVVWLLSENSYDLLINEIGTYQGTVRTDSASILVFIIHADGDWTVTMMGE